MNTQNLFPEEPEKMPGDGGGAEAPDAAPEAAAETATAAPETAVDPMAAALADAAKYRDLALRTAADFDNFRKRSAREREESVKYANASLIERLLPVCDSFDLGLEAARSVEGASAVVAGFEMVKKQLDDFLKDAGVEVIDATGAAFDPNLHDAMGSEHSAEVPEGGVVRQLRRGYKLRDRVLRAAGVFVSKGPAQG